MHPHRPLLVALLLAAGLSIGRAQNLVVNAGFEDRLESWSTFVPADSVVNAPQITVEEGDAHGGRLAARLQSAASSRFALSSRSGTAVVEGERYRISAWYRAEPGATPAPGTPGFLLRANFSGDKPGVDIAAGHLYVGPTGIVSSTPGRSIAAPLAEIWTPVEAVIQVPPEARRMNLNIFAWSLAGAVWVDDVGVERVPASTPTSPVAAASTGAPAAKPVAPFPPVPMPPLVAGSEREIDLENPGFESGLQGWDAGSDRGMSQLSSQAAHRGAYGLRVIDADTENGSSFHSNYLPAAPGRLYQIRFWGRIVNGDGMAVYLRFHDKDRRPLNTAELRNENLFFLPKEASSFRQFVLEGTAPAGTVAVRIWLHSITRSVVTADFDEFSVIEVQP